MFRRTFLTSLTGAGLIVASAPGASAVASRDATIDAASVSLPACNVSVLAVAAQAEWRKNQSSLRDDSSTRLVQAALRARGLKVTADGWYGPGTRAAYQKFQESLGYRGTSANGLPGPTSLARLAAGRFRLTHPVTLGNVRDAHRGVRVNTRTRKMLVAAESRVGWSITLVQGEYHPGVKASAHTHDGGGSVDVRVRDWTTTQKWRTVQALRTVGFAAWLRGPDNPHIHAMAIGDTDAHVNAAQQTADYITGRDGYAAHGPDNTPAKYRVPFTWWERYAGL